MKGIYTPLTKIRRQVFSELARLAFEDLSLETELNKSVFKIIPGELPKFRDSIFKERAIVSERLRLALGLPLRKLNEHRGMESDLDFVNIDKRAYSAPLVNVIPFACDACPEKTYLVTNNCRKCIAHPCKKVCPVNAIELKDNGAFIDSDKCIKCGKCKQACPYSAIVQFDRPCASICGVNAIESDELGRAKINKDKCVSCGMCMINCPFGAIADKSQIFQLSKSLVKKENKICAMIAPSFVGQFGPLASPSQILEGLKKLGFDDVFEVSLGADIVTIDEAKEFMEHVPNDKPFLGTSCCPTWAMAAKKNFPEFQNYISSSSTPMGVTARIIKKKYPNSKIVFIGPCIAKKLEALNEDFSPFVDFVITYEELMGMFIGKDIELSELENNEEINQSSYYGREFASAGGVANAVSQLIKKDHPDMDLKIDSASGLSECIKMLKIAKAGKRDGYLLEGMGCPGGCVGGPGTMLQINKGKFQVTKFAKESPYKNPDENPLAIGYFKEDDLSDFKNVK